MLMTNFINLLTENSSIVLVVLVLAVIIALAVLLIMGKKELVKALVYKLVLQAEISFIKESGAGHAKYEQVITEIREAMPPIIKLVVSEEDIDTWIEEAVAKLKVLIG